MYSEGNFLGETDIGVSSSSKRLQRATIRAISSAQNNQVTCYYVPRDTYSKFVMKNNDAATSLLKRRLTDLSKARHAHIDEMDRRFQVAERVGSASRRVQVRKVSREHSSNIFCPFGFHSSHPYYLNLQFPPYTIIVRATSRNRNLPLWAGPCWYATECSSHVWQSALIHDTS